ncbi:MAG: winged helix-turn-helix domain-containing protein [Nanopusillaceae archaeon]
MILIDGKGYNGKKTSFFDEISKKILYELSENELTLSELAKKLNMSPQLLNYYLNNKLKDFIIKIGDGKKVKYKSYKLYYDIVNEKYDYVIFQYEKRNFGKFIRDGILDCYIVVGSPDPHGPFSARARDLHYVGFLTMYFGKFVDGFKDENYIKIDTDIINTNIIRENLIVIGGPVTNMIMYRINTSLKVRFLQEYNWDIYSEFTNKRYSEELAGLIANIKNPFNEEKNILLFSGKRAIGTKIAIRYFVKNKIDLDREFYLIVEGKDEDGDGIVEKEYLIEINYL